MALHIRKDSYATKELTLSSFVALCSDCPKLCRERTERVIENRSRAPRGWEKEYISVAEQRREEDYDLCLGYCQRVSTICPVPDVIERSEKTADKKSAQSSTFNEAPFLQQMSRCEYAVADFSRVLFSLAHKPSKVVFENIDPKTGEKCGGGEEGEPTEVHKKVLGSAAINEEILHRWSTAKKGRAKMEDMGILRSTEDTSIFQQDLERRKCEDAVKARGTTPTW